jgi:hypothetical protein
MNEPKLACGMALDVANATLVECRRGWRLKATFVDGNAVDRGGYRDREDALRELK